MDIITRAQWGARYARGFRDAPLPAQEVWLHHSVTLAPDLTWVDTDRDGVEDDEERAMRLLEQIGQDRFGGGISYTFAVMPSGRVYEGHGVDRQGAHTGGRNDIARAIVLVGNYETYRPTPAQVQAVVALLQHGKAQGWWTTAALNGGHRQAPGASTACPGRYGMAIIGTVNEAAARPPAEYDTREEDAMLVAAEINGKNTFGIYSGGVLTGLTGGGAVNASKRDPLWLEASDWAELDRKSRQIVGDPAAAK
jgi:hypothetical protein